MSSIIMEEYMVAGLHSTGEVAEIHKQREQDWAWHGLLRLQNSFPGTHFSPKAISPNLYKPIK